ncbi:hypothetical protein DSO57_1036209 [Entomophthora muscae]|uniref:Uncharacterized protein n=1 Tax=Entomophthora muscae TaxID=34485 RepID=A0ACC2TXU8_9FUNG|nr:hypothetical protein DSO57_1036209 [Entomophthora muscae]
MSAFPFSRTLSDSFADPNKPRDGSWSASTALHRASTQSANHDYHNSLCSPPLLSLPSSNLRTNRSYTAGYNRSPPGDYGDIFLPFHNQTRSSSLSQEGQASKAYDLGTHPSPFPAFRSQSAVCYDQLSNPNQPSNESSQRTMAMRRPPAGFNLPRKEESRNTFPSLATVRSVPASRCNSDDFAELLSKFDSVYIDEEKQKSFSSKGYRDNSHFRASRDPSAHLSSKDREYNLAPHLDTSFLDDDSHSEVSSNSRFLNQDNFIPYDQGENYMRTSLMFGTSKMAGSQLHSSVNFRETLSDSLFNDARPDNFNNQSHGLRVARTRSATINALSHNSFAPPIPSAVQVPSNGKTNRRRNPAAAPSQTKVPCRYFPLGQCTKGSQCQFPHTLPGQNEAEAGRFSPPGASICSTPTAFEYKTSPPRTASPPRNARPTNKPSRRTGDTEKNAASLSEAKFAQADFSTYVGKLYSLCQDQLGCRYLQKTLEEGDPSFSAHIFAELSPYFAELMIDPFGNYLSQKLMEWASGAQRVILLHNAFGHFSRIAHNPHGTRATQKMIEILSSSSKSTDSDELDPETNKAMQILSQALAPHVVSLIKDSNGNHVIQRCISLFPSQHNQFIFDAISKDCLAVGTHKHGCCVIQRCFDNANFHQRDQLAIVIASNALSLVQDPFGNYVVQYVIRLENCNYTRGLIQNFVGHMPRLSAQKFSSNVIELCIKAADANLRQQLIEELLWSRELEQLLQDSYANYVVQTCLDCAEPALRDQLVERIKPILLTTRSSPFVKRIQARILSGEASHWANTLPLENTAAIANAPFLAYNPHHGIFARPAIPAGDVSRPSHLERRI